METLLYPFQFLIENYGPPIFIPIIMFLIVGIYAQWNLYEKCGLRGVACIVPGWNITEFLRIMGRPAWHIVFFLIPVYNIYFIVKVYIELCNSFGKYGIIDYISVIVFNGLYVLYLGLEEEAVYKGPIYSMREQKAAEAAANSKKGKSPQVKKVYKKKDPKPEAKAIA